jgi:hypothetical protein
MNTKEEGRRRGKREDQKEAEKDVYEMYMVDKDR